MKKYLISVFALLMLFISAFAYASEALTTGNLVGNASFEQDWYNVKAQLGGISAYNSMYYGQSDKIPDAWRVSGKALWDESNGYKSGKSLKFYGEGYAEQTISFCNYSHALGKQLTRGMGYADGNFYSANIEKYLRNVRGWFYVKSENISETTVVGAVINIGGLSKTIRVNASTIDWAKYSFEFTSSELSAFFSPKKYLPGKISVRLEVSNVTSGNVRFDEIHIEEDLGDEINLIETEEASFEKGVNYPEGWSDIKRFRWYGAYQYYMWNHWFHYFTENRGEVVLDDLISRSGKKSLRMAVFPGENKYVESPEIVMNQMDTRPIEIGVWVKADRVLTLDIKAINENGEYLSDFDLIIDSIQKGFNDARGVPYILYTGTYNWKYLRKTVGWDKPVKSIRVQLIGRGNNGDIMDCVDKKQTTNQVGTIWWDDLRVVERETSRDELINRRVKIPESKPVAGRDLCVENIDFGERLFGENNLSIGLLNKSNAQKEIPVIAEIVSPSGDANKIFDYKTTIKPNEGNVIDIPYEIRVLCKDYKEQYRLNLQIDGRKTSVAFGTWPEAVQVRLERVYSFPDEDTQICFINFGVAKKTLERSKKLEFSVIRRMTEKEISKTVVGEFQKEFSGFKERQPLMDWKVDEFNFFLWTIDMSKIPMRIHPQNEPVRDHRIALNGYDENGEVLFTGNSPYFGKMERHSEKLDAIKTVDVKDGLLYVNDNPFYLRACLPHWYDLYPAPSNAKFAWNNKTIKESGFNSYFQNIAYDLEDTRERISPEYWWQTNLYSAIWYPYDGSNTWGQVYSKDTALLEMVLKDCEKIANNPYILTVSPMTVWEGGLNLDICDNISQLKREEEMVAKIRQISKRPQFTSGGGIPEQIQAGYFFDIIGPESNFGLGAPTELNTTYFLPVDAEYKTKMSMTFPNVFNDCPLDMMRFETYEGIIRGQRGWISIGQFNDGTIFRGFFGELKWLEGMMFAKEKGPEVRTNIDVSMMQRKVGKNLVILATTAQPIEHGLWFWHDNSSSGKKSHTGVMLRHKDRQEETHNYAMHGWRGAKPILLKKGDIIKQDIFIPENADVDHLILMFRGNGRWNHSAVIGKFDWNVFDKTNAKYEFCSELILGMYNFHYSSDSQALINRFLLREETFHNMGALLEKGKWVTVEMPAEKIGIDEKYVDGVVFVSHGDTVLWDHTRIVREKEEMVLCDDYIVYPQEFWKEVKFSVPGLKKGTKIKVVFEDREIIAGDGEFTDDFSGGPVYHDMWKGIYGDWTPTLNTYSYLGYAYHYDPAVVRIYEIQIEY